MACIDISKAEKEKEKEQASAKPIQKKHESNM